MTNFIRTSGVDQINSIRKLLWESIYTNFSNMQSLSNSINESFHPDSLDTVDFDFNDMSIYLKSKDRGFNYNEANLNMINAYKGFVKDMYNKGKFNKDIYNLCINNIDNLFFITFNNDNNMKVHL